MPWKRRRIQNEGGIYWTVAGLSSVLIGLLVGFLLWGERASLIDDVERQINASESKVRELERRLQTLEAKAGVVNASAQDDKTALAY